MDVNRMKRALLIAALAYWTAVATVFTISYDPFAFFSKAYWGTAAGFFVLCALWCIRCLQKAKQGKNSPLAVLYSILFRYGFLIKQLIIRDFKAKYKRSALGMAWSVMSPLLTMCVQYFVFSAVFKGSIENYPVYLLAGIVFFNFFNESITLGMSSILANAPLIKKVYMPKYIYPFSRVLTSLINFLLALLPLFLVSLVTGISLRPSILLLFFDIGCMFFFLLGMTLLLCTVTTFFQDVQYLWNIVCMIWMYATPIFYPESIIPTKYLPLYRLNPLNHFITFARTCIIGGVSPQPTVYLWCLLWAALIFVLGMFVFRKYQDQFVLYV